MFAASLAALACISAAAAQTSAAPSSWAATATWETIASQTYAPVYHPTVTQTVTLASQTWTTVYESWPGSPQATPASVQGNVIRVAVGTNGTLTFDPSTVKASPRDTVVFEFKAKNHTVTQSSFNDPCRKLEFTSTTGQKGFDSGFMSVNSSLTSDFPTFNVTVNGTDPIYVYCRQTGHCGKGMVLIINETPERNITAFQELAKLLNGTTDNSTSTGQTKSQGAAPVVHPSMASAFLLAVGGLFIFAL